MHLCHRKCVTRPRNVLASFGFVETHTYITYRCLRKITCAWGEEEGRMCSKYQVFYSLPVFSPPQHKEGEMMEEAIWLSTAISYLSLYFLWLLKLHFLFCFL